MQPTLTETNDRGFKTSTNSSRKSKCFSSHLGCCNGAHTPCSCWCPGGLCFLPYMTIGSTIPTLASRSLAHTLHASFLNLLLKVRTSMHASDVQLACVSYPAELPSFRVASISSTQNGTFSRESSFCRKQSLVMRLVPSCQAW